MYYYIFFFSSRRRHTRCALVTGSSDVCSSDLRTVADDVRAVGARIERRRLDRDEIPEQTEVGPRHRPRIGEADEIIVVEAKADVETRQDRRVIGLQIVRNGRAIGESLTLGRQEDRKSTRLKSSH